ncbi:MAG: SCO family protein [Myxococcaceae bacterium]
MSAPTMRELYAGYFPNVAVQDDAARSFKFYDEFVKDRTVIVNFIFTTCTGICPRSTAKLIEVKKQLAARFPKDISFVSVSVDPVVDTPETLRKYMARFEIEPGKGWRFVTGTEANCRAIRERLGFRSDDKMDHTGLFIWGNERTGVWGMIPSISSAEQIALAVSGAADSASIFPTVPVAEANPE